ncbi:FAD-dependent oxidoreductase [Helcococcus ovis]|uniref:FAD-dependent oxidoreductase n=1 Tax=Helcococcus ovis TaxID=72026 RepID=UPI0038BD480F
MRYDSIIIGFGKAGKTLAATLAKKGEKVSLIEKDKKMYGGTCINIGCLPSKNLLNSSKDGKLSQIDKKEFYKKSIIKKKNLIAKLNEANYNNVVNSGAEVIDGSASFKDKETVLVKTESEELEVKADKIFINTGATPFIPKMEGIENNENVFTSTSIMNLEELPENLTIIGGGFISLEFASIYANFGSKVRILIREDKFLPREDTDISDEIRKSLEEKEIEILLNSETSRINGDTLYYVENGEEKLIENTKVLISTGRRANVKDLNLESAGVELTDRGLIKVNEYLETTQENIYALGDVSSQYQFTYTSLDDFRIVKSQLLGDKSYSISERKVFATSTFIEPTYSRIGLNEKEAKEKGIDYKVNVMKVESIPNAKVLGKTKGLLKALVDSKTNKILGVMLFVERSEEIINFVKLAMDEGLEYTKLRDFVFTHPTISEALNDLFNM